MTWANRIKLFLEFKRNFDRYLEQYDGDQLQASQAVFQNQGWDVSVSGQLPTPACYLIYGNHRHFVDSCAANLALPTGCRCKRVVNTGIARKIGRKYLASNFGVSSRFRWRRFQSECEDAYTRFFYLFSASWFRTSSLDIRSVIRWLRNGNSLILFPSGVFGRARWRRRIGIFAMEYLNNPRDYELPLYLVALQSSFCFKTKSLKVDLLDCFPANDLKQIAAMDPAGRINESWITGYLSSRYATKCTGDNAAPNRATRKSA